MHLLQMTKLIDEFKPHVVVMDPVTNLISVGLQVDVKSMLTRFVDFLKARQITSLFTSLTSPGGSLEQSEAGVSSLMDTWIVLKDIEAPGRTQPWPHHCQVQGYGTLQSVQGVPSERKRTYIGRCLPKSLRGIDRADQKA